MMLYNYIALGVIIASLAAIIFILVRKFSKLKTLDVATILEEKQKKVRDRILLGRLKKKIEQSPIIGRAFGSGQYAKKDGGFWSNLYQKALNLERKYQYEALKRPQASDAAFEEKVKSIILDAADYFRKNEFSEAEKKYIEVVSFDASNRSAYKGLTEVYLAQKEYQQALQTVNYILKLDLKKGKSIEKKDIKGKKYRTYTNADEVGEDYQKLGEIYSIKSDYKKAFENFKKSVAVLPCDPKSLDLLINASIILKDKVTALTSFHKLAEVNPENQKLLDYRKKIDEMRE